MRCDLGGIAQATERRFLLSTAGFSVAITGPVLHRTVGPASRLVEKCDPAAPTLPTTLYATTGTQNTKSAREREEGNGASFRSCHLERNQWSSSRLQCNRSLQSVCTRLFMEKNLWISYGVVGFIQDREQGFIQNSLCLKFLLSIISVGTKGKLDIKARLLETLYMVAS